MTANRVDMTAWLRVGAACVVVAAVASTLAACSGGDEVPTPTASPTVTAGATEAASPTLSAADYERGISEWDFLFLRAAAEFFPMTGEAVPSEPEELLAHRARLSAKLHILRDALSRLPSTEPPLPYRRFDSELRRAVDIMQQGADMIIEGWDAGDPDEAATGGQLLFDGRDARFSAFCFFLPPSSPLLPLRPSDDFCQQFSPLRP